MRWTLSPIAVLDEQWAGRAVYAAAMVTGGEWPSAPPLRSERLSLEPLRIDHAEEMAPLLNDAHLYEFIGGHPPTLEELRGRYQRQLRGRSADGSETWLNWIVRRRDRGEVVGTVQATITAQGDRSIAAIAWVIGSRHQRRGYAREAAAAMAAWLRHRGAEALIADIHPQHDASIKLAAALGLTPTGTIVDGEIRWTG